MCFSVKRLKGAGDSDCLLVRIQPPLSAQPFGLKDRSIDFLILEPRSVWLFARTKAWPIDVLFCRPVIKDIATRERIEFYETQTLGEGELYRTENEAQAKMDEMRDFMETHRPKAPVVPVSLLRYPTSDVPDFWLITRIGFDLGVKRCFRLRQIVVADDTGYLLVRIEPPFSIEPLEVRETHVEMLVLQPYSVSTLVPDIIAWPVEVAFEVSLVADIDTRKHVDSHQVLTLGIGELHPKEELARTALNTRKLQHD